VSNKCSDFDEGALVREEIGAVIEGAEMLILMFDHGALRMHRIIALRFI
jgi:hypothetical protein